MSAVNRSYDFIGDWFCIFYATRLASKTGGHFSIQSELKPELICDLLAQRSLTLHQLHPSCLKLVWFTGLFE